MEYLYAALLLHKLKQDITEENLKNVVKATGTTPDEVRIKALVAAIGEVNIDEALKNASLPTQQVQVNAPAAQSAPSGPAEKEEKKEEKKEEEALEGLSALFG
ncbi:MAG TPA: 50S ribosomal protein P1 [Nitrososphaeraceae archaeon]|jgi:large subunit ribosomal protein L12